MYANHIKWRGDYDKALTEAKNSNKTLMVLLIKNDCSKCKKIVKLLFTDKRYIDELNDLVVAVIVNKDQRHSYPIEMLWSKKIPALFFIDNQTENFIINPQYFDTTPQEIRKIVKKLKYIENLSSKTN